ncbi:RNA polymerase sigma factor [Sphingomonas abaci]|uniref:RNA polymerase sigma-70 factor (ECF subfamily) n=1 Tax=Sphingomonas abaci TaxID=237611 RepID=A0A7W7AM16_9SPHN|nr:RNA polymerase sigma factor [Sphingomonas abaci]MBB4618477.1 RNA polymerase sigma-70 factor (ECF subfamily) [Sphingomonas abaci]
MRALVPRRIVLGEEWRVTPTHPLAETFLAQRPVLLRYLRARGAAEEAEDLLQDLWLKLASTSGQGVERPESYMMRMAHNLMLDRARATRRRLTRDDDYHRDGAEDGAAPSALADLIARERLDQVDRLLAALGERTDRIFRRHRVEGVAQRDIAAELGISLSAVEKHLQKAYRAIAAWQRGDGAVSGEART